MFFMQRLWTNNKMLMVISCGDCKCQIGLLIYRWSVTTGEGFVLVEDGEGKADGIGRGYRGWRRLAWSHPWRIKSYLSILHGPPRYFYSSIFDDSLYYFYYLSCYTCKIFFIYFQIWFYLILILICEKYIYFWHFFYNLSNISFNLSFFLKKILPAFSLKCLVQFFTTNEVVTLKPYWTPKLS